MAVRPDQQRERGLRQRRMYATEKKQNWPQVADSTICTINEICLGCNSGFDKQLSYRPTCRSYFM